MMNRKDRTFEAIDKIIYKYLNPDEFDLKTDYFHKKTCALCGVHGNEFGGCIGCPLACRNGFEGCIDFITHKNASYLSSCGINLTQEIREAFQERAKFFEELLVELKDIPASQFTKKGWKYFDIDRDR